LRNKPRFRSLINLQSTLSTFFPLLLSIVISTVILKS
jgi:hypothetical protein